MNPAEKPEISVVIGAKDARQAIAACLSALLAQTAGQNVEIIVADGSSDGTAEVVAGQFPDVTLLHGDRRDLIPQLWGQGIAHASGHLIAILSAHCIPAGDWLANLQRLASTHDAQVAGFGGPIEGPVGGTRLDWAVYFSRYSAYMPPVTAGPVGEIAGDNAVYRRSALEVCGAEMQAGFWETLIHVCLRAEGYTLAMSPDIPVRLGPTTSAWPFLQARFWHGRHYGSTRPGLTWPGRLARFLAAPVLLPFLLLRIHRRVATHRSDWRSSFFQALPWLIVILSAWSLGESSGYLWPQR